MPIQRSLQRELFLILGLLLAVGAGVSARLSTVGASAPSIEPSQRGMACDPELMRRAAQGASVPAACASEAPSRVSLRVRSAATTETKERTP